MSISADVLTSYKKIDEAAADALLAKEIAANNKKIVVLDDDPTGVQTVHDIHVYTNWDHDSIKAGFECGSCGSGRKRDRQRVHLHQPQRFHSARTLSAGDRASQGRL